MDPLRTERVGKVGLLSAISEVFEIKCECWILKLWWGWGSLKTENVGKVGLIKPFVSHISQFYCANCDVFFLFGPSTRLMFDWKISLSWVIVM